MHPITHVPHLDLYIIMVVCSITHVSNCPCAPLLMWPIAHVPHYPTPIDLEGSCCITHMPHHSCSPSPMCPITLPLVLMCPIAHVPHSSCGLLPMHPITLLPCRSIISHCHSAHMPHHPYSHE